MHVKLRKICNASPRICQPYRGFADFGRSGPQTVRSGQKVDGKIRYFRNEGCAVSEREARSAFRLASGKTAALPFLMAIAVEGVRHRGPLLFLSRGEDARLDSSFYSS